MAWACRFREQIPQRLLYGYSSLAAVGGLLLLLLFPAAGLGMLGASVVFRLAAYRFGKRLRIECFSWGFLVEESDVRTIRRASRYGWQDVTGTRFVEQHTMAWPAPTGWFVVTTGDGLSFQVSSRMNQFSDLVQLWSALTPHLPYMWQREARGGSLPRYRKVPRRLLQHPEDEGMTPSGTDTLLG